MQDDLRAKNQQQDQFNLIDCDASGFQFKYDPKLIKSSSIETLCGANDGNGGEEDDTIEDLSQFKTNSELLMSLQPCWSTNNSNANNDLSFSPLVPILANCYGNTDQSQSANNGDLSSTNGGQVQAADLKHAGDDYLGSSALLNDLTQSHDQIEDHLNDGWSRKHNLDELTTSLLAELTASLKAQVDLKNKRSGLCSSTIASNNDHQDAAKQASNQLSQLNGLSRPSHDASFDNNNLRTNNQNATEPDPLDLINEFDTLIQNNK
jgi:hypothetical protein